MLRFGSSTTVQLLEYRLPPGAATAVPLRKSDHPVSHFALRVTDIDAAAERLRGAAGVEALAGPQTVPDGVSAGLRWVYFLTPWGLSIELIQLPSGMTVNPTEGAR